MEFAGAFDEESGNSLLAFEVDWRKFARNLVVVKQDPDSMSYVTVQYHLLGSKLETEGDTLVVMLHSLEVHEVAEVLSAPSRACKSGLRRKNCSVVEVLSFVFLSRAGDALADPISFVPRGLVMRLISPERMDQTVLTLPKRRPLRE